MLSQNNCFCWLLVPLSSVVCCIADFWHFLFPYTASPECTPVFCCSGHSGVRLFTSDKKRRYMFLPVFICLSVCEQDYWKSRAWIWMKCCMSTDIGTWTNWLTFEHTLDYSPDAGTRLLSPILYALQHGILFSRENPSYGYWAAAMRDCKMVLRRTTAATRGFTMVLFAASRRNNFVGGECSLPSALLVVISLRWRPVCFNSSCQSPKLIPNMWIKVF